MSSKNKSLKEEKRVLKAVVLGFSIVLAAILTVFLCTSVFKAAVIGAFEIKAKAEKTYEPDRVIYNGRAYKPFYSDSNIVLGSQYEDKFKNRVYIKCEDSDVPEFLYYFCTPLLFFESKFEYFIPACPEFDTTDSFIVVNHYDRLDEYIAEDFAIPEFNENTIDCISASFIGDRFYDKETVSKFVNAALNGEEIEIDNELLRNFHYYQNDGLEKWSVLFKYKDCPLYVDYCIIKTESGKYRVVEPRELR